MMEKDGRCGLMETIHVKSGMDVRIADFQSPGSIEKRFEQTSPSLRFYFHISGGGHWEFRSRYESARQNKLPISDHLSTVLYYSELEGVKYWQPMRRQFHISAHITPALLSAYLNGHLDEFPKDLQAIFEGRGDRGFSHVGHLSHAMNDTVQHLLNCPYSGPMKELYIESKAIELIAHKLAQVVSPDVMGQSPSNFDLREMGRIEFAKDILCSDLENPPKLIDLSRSVGMNHCRLNQGFREVYGTTVFGYLRRTRLIEAKRLLEHDGLNVTEAALSVGYSSISSFSNAFFANFGLRPTDCVKKRH